MTWGWRNGHYFDAVKQMVKAKVRIEVVPAPRRGATPAEVVETAATRLRELTRGDSADRNDRQAVWVLIDLEGEQAKRKQASDAVRKSRDQTDIKIALSDPCFEMWTLLHLSDTGRQFADCQAVSNAIKRLWKAQFRQDFEKARMDCARILPMMNDACERARRQRARGAQSWTDVYLVVESIHQLGGGEQTQA